VLTIDRECDGWQCDVGMVPTVLERMAPSPENTIAITCGPPIIIKYALISFEKLGFTPEQTKGAPSSSTSTKSRRDRRARCRAEGVSVRRVAGQAECYP
jgi:NAD(P)H-flavin reductase